MAKYINQSYDSKCALVFDSGPFIERQGNFEDNGAFDYCPEDNPAVTRLVKVPAQQILTAMSQATTEYSDLSSHYFKLTKHKHPLPVLTTARELEARGMYGDYERHDQCVQTPAMTIMYYEVLEIDDYFINEMW